MRKVFTVLAAGLVLSSSLAIVPAHAAANSKIVNGVACTAVNKKIVGKGSESYICSKNPYYLKTKLTWTWIECINAQKQLAYFKASHAAMVASGASAADLKSDQDFVDSYKSSTGDACKKGV
jgi:hypothetical protein